MDDLTAAECAPEVSATALRRMRLVAHLLDESVQVPGTDRRVGLDPIVGVLPVAGDALAAALSLYLIIEAASQGVRRTTLVRMFFNVALDFAAGAVPILGDVFDAYWKANRRNYELAVADLAHRGP